MKTYDPLNSVIHSPEGTPIIWWGSGHGLEIPDPLTWGWLRQAADTLINQVSPRYSNRIHVTVGKRLYRAIETLNASNRFYTDPGYHPLSLYGLPLTCDEALDDWVMRLVDVQIRPIERRAAHWVMDRIVGPTFEREEITITLAELIPSGTGWDDLVIGPDLEETI